MCIMELAYICLGSTWMASTIPALLLALYFIQKFYLRTSRQMRLLQLEAKSPLYKHFTETVEGLSTLRAFGWQEHFSATLLAFLDNSQRPYYLLFCIQRWLNLVLDLTVAAAAIIVVTLALLLPQSSSPGNIGIALTSILAFGNSLQALISSWTTAETMLGSVSRTRTFERDTPREIDAVDGCEDPDDEWTKGDVQFHDFTVAYANGTVGLNKISLDIKAGTKLVVSGRTGSGKSTLVSALLRLVEPTSGRISIDGIDISRISLNTVLRDRIICLPQDAIVFPASVRFNLDPRNQLTNDDASLNAALATVELSELVASRGGLDATITSEVLSHGEAQLMALARAIVRKRILKGRCMLVMDESTSGLDAAMEKTIRAIVALEFGNQTVIEIAHRQSIVQQNGASLVLEKGEVQSFQTR